MTALLEIRNLKAEVAGKQIIDGMNLVLNKGEVHAIMGPNGSGKSTLSYVMAGKPGYEATQGEIDANGRSLGVVVGDAGDKATKKNQLIAEIISHFSL